MKKEKVTPEEKALRMEEWKSLIISRKGPHDVDAVERSKNGKRTNTNK